MNKKLPLIYHPRYDITFWGLERFHPFDTRKYSKAFEYVCSHAGITLGDCCQPQLATREQLLLVHTPEYLESLNNSTVLALGMEIMFIANLASSVIHRKVLQPMLYATGGTILGIELAQEYGWAINLSGGYHHAKAASAGGFCFYNDIAIAINVAWKKNPNLRCMIIDLDAHQGNGYASILKADPRIAILDIYNEDVYPHDESAKKYITFNVPTYSGISDQEYLNILKGNLARAIEKTKPHIIIYNAGTDILAGDALGGMNISHEGVLQRDVFVFEQAKKNNIPILMLLSGGYTKGSAQVIGKSIVHIMQLMNA